MRYHRLFWIALSLLVAAAPGDALAKKKKKPAPAAKAPRANAAAVNELMGDYKWGMTLDEVLGVLEKRLMAQANEKIQKISDVYEQNKMRKAVKTQIAEVRKTHVPFKGQRIGWDVSIIEGEFGHKNDESMVVFSETDEKTGVANQRFFFFVDGKLWKMFIAFNMDQYKERTFAVFRDAMESRYGKAAEQMRRTPDNKEVVGAIYWRGNGVYLRAIDLLQFYSNFCLAVSDDSVEKWIHARRQERFPRPPPKPMVSSPAASEPVNDPNANVIQEMTGGDKQPVIAPKKNPE